MLAAALLATAANARNFPGKAIRIVVGVRITHVPYKGAAQTARLRE